MKDPSYDDIINLPHFRSLTHPHMDRCDRAAQFMPFMALTGYDAAIRETARLTERRLELDDDTKTLLDMKLHALSEQINDRPEVAITYFRKDERKAGGVYETVSGVIDQIDGYRRIVILEGIKIPMDDIFEIESELFNSLF